MLNHSTTEVFINELVVPAEDLVGEEGMGFRYIIDGWNAERILVSVDITDHWLPRFERTVARLQ